MSVRKIILFVLNLGWLFSAATGPAQVSSPLEYQLKSAFLYNFAKFIVWPPETFADDTSPFVIGVLGRSPFDSQLEQTVAGKKINRHPITVQPIKSAVEGTNCHILFICDSETKRLPAILKSLKDTPVLTVSETDHFTEQGGMINFVQEANKIRFQINNDAAKAARLKISSKLLNLAVSPAS